MGILKIIAAWYALLVPFAIWNYGKFGKYAMNCWLALDQLLNTWLGGDPDMTLSGRMGRDIKQGKCWLCTPICRALNFISRQKDHCGETDLMESDEGRDQIFTE